MKETVKQIEENINKLLDMYDHSMELLKKSKSISEENTHKKNAMAATDCIEHEMAKLQELRSFEPEIRVVTSSLRQCLDLGREITH